MSFKKVSMGMAIALALSAGSAVAAVPGDTGTITFHGMVSNTTCKVSLDQKIDQSGNDFDVTLDTVSVADFGTTALGTTSNPGPEKIQPGADRL
ncbi:hypothetical protein L8S24_02825 [Enterobacter kobei]|uniref:hypothetical protein n=1 Tax=Enterobacter kobei TaxID=208224 RepID=UPI0020060702|nr:hypothetical protein [Enterobacter kobei]MCK6998344.1 hypothetical protein [Enterobacter kobei]